MAFPPTFADRPRVYVFVASGSTTRILRYDVDTATDRVVMETEEEVLQFERSNTTHVGGQIRFGPDGYLYISVGDDGSPGTISSNAQNLGLLSGKILRIDPEGAPSGTPYRIPADNPFADGVGGAPEILAWGLRNPWRFAFHPITGDLYIGDAGENDREEINILRASAFASGVNFGWPFFEGSLPVAGQTNPGLPLTGPAYEYPTEFSVIGGDFFTAGASSTAPVFVFGDFSGTIRVLTESAPGEVRVQTVTTGYPLTCFGRDHDGSILFGSWTQGVLRVSRAQTLLAPALTNASGIYIGPLSVGWSKTQKQAILRYTLDGSVPDESSPLLQEDTGLTIWQPGQVNLRAFYPGLAPSETVSADYQLKAQQVWMPWGPLSDYTQINLSTYTPEMTIRYTVDNYPVNEASPVYNPATPSPSLFVSQPTTVRARSYYPGWLPGDESVRAYELRLPWPGLAVPQIDGRSLFLAPVTATSTAKDVVFRYTTNGSTPDTNSPIYSNAVPVVSGVPLVVGAFKPGMTSAVTSLAADVIVPSRGSLSPIVATNAPSTPRHVARADDGTFFVSGGSFAEGIWRVVPGGRATAIQPATGSYNSSKVVELRMGIDGSLLSLTTNSPIGSLTLRRFSPPSYARGPDVSIGVTAASFMPEPSGTFLTSASARSLFRVTPGSAPQTLALATTNITAVAASTQGDIVVGTTDRKIERLVSGAFQPVFGSGTFRSIDGPCSVAGFYELRWFVFDRIGNLYVVDRNWGGNVRKISPAGFVSTLVARTATAPSGERALRADGSISVDENGVLYVGDTSQIWRFVQDDWDNDGVPDALESQLGESFLVGRDDRRHDHNQNGLSNAAEFVLGTDARTRPAAVGMKAVSSRQAVLAVRTQPGQTVELLVSFDGQTWHSTGVTRTATGHDIVEPIEMPAGVRACFYRWRIVGPSP